jgi:sugar lactone lactonase YvrE
MHDRRLLVTILAGALVAAATLAAASGPTWMPGFPMRMGTNVMLMWAPVPGATAYNVYKSGAEGQLGELLAAVPANNHMDMNVPLDKDAFYTVKAVVGGTEGAAGPAGKVAGVKALDPPKWVGHMESDGRVALRFEGASAAAFYNVYRSKSKDGPFQLVGSVQEPRYNDADIQPGETYYYQVNAVDRNSVESPRSETYAYTFEKKAVAAAIKVVPKVEKLVTRSPAILGNEQRPLAQPVWLAVDGGELVVADAGKLVRVSPADGVVTGEIPIPAGWGTLRGIALSSDGLYLTTWAQFNGVRGLRPDGAVAFEFRMQKPTAADYAALGRQADWEVDQGFDAVPAGIAEDPEGRLWVTDPAFGQVHVYDRRGNLLKRLGVPRPRGFELSDMKNPTLLAYHRGTNRMYVLDPLVQTVRAFDVKTMDFITDAEGKPLYGWKRGGAGPGGFQEPRGIAVTRQGELVIADGIDGRIQIFDPEMEYLSQLVTAAGGTKPAGMGAPAGMAVEGNTLYVCEPLAARIAVFTL